MTNRMARVVAVGSLRRSAAWVAALAALSCSSPTGVDRGPGGAVATVSVTPSASTVMVGADLPLQVVVRDEIGAPLSSAPVVWSVRDGNIASVSPTGVVTGRALGSTQVAASSGGRSGVSTITVQQPAVASVSVQPGAANLVIGDSTTLTVLVTDVGGRTVTNRVLVWTSSDTRVATVTSSGLVTAAGVGSATITASSEGKSGTSTVTVVRAPVLSVAVEPGTLSIPSGASRPLTVTVVDANRVNVTDREVRWTSSNELVASVSASGAVTAKAPGTATITATSEGKSGAVSITVTPAAVGTVSILPASASLTVGGTASLAPTVTDVNGVPMAGREVTWTSSDPLVASVSPAGVVVANAVGSATITASSDGKSGTAAVTVVPVPAANVASVTIEPSSATILVGRQATLTATTRDASGNVLGGRVVTWTSSNSLVATVSQEGVVTAIGSGAATVNATVDGKSGTAVVTVSLVPVGSVAVLPKSASLTAGESVTLTSVVSDQAGNVLTGRPVSWSSSAGALATVSSAGVVTALAPGSVTITATSEGFSDNAVVTIAPAPVGSVTLLPTNVSMALGQSSQVTATVKDTRGVVVTDRVVSWTSSNTIVATVTQTGLVTAVAVGSAAITATSEGRQGSAAVTVSAVATGSVTVEPVSSNLRVGETRILTARVTDINGTVVTDRPVTWSSSNTIVATVSQTGVLNALAPGSATISASAGGKSGAATVVVTRIPVGSVVLAPVPASLIVGQTTTLTATIRDTSGVAVTNRVVTWSSSNTLLATVSASGVVTAVAPGTATITATSEGKSGSTSVTVIPVPVNSVSVTPATRTVVIGATTALTATVRDASGNTLLDRIVTWSSSDASIATVSAAGVVTAVAKGSATITASSEGKIGTSVMTIVPVPVASVTVQPPTVRLVVGQDTSLSTTVKDANGTVVTDRVVTWISSNTSVATVTSSGRVTAVGAGSAFITASSEGWNGSSAVTVVKVPVASVTIPATATLVAGQSTTLTPVVKDTNGVVVTDRVVTWSSSNTAVATVSATGVVKALKTGMATITATSEGKIGSTELTVMPAPVGSVTLSPTAPTLASGSPLQIVATVRDTTGATVTDRAVTWTSSDTAVATVSATGVVTGLSTGTATITASSETKSGISTVRVTPGPAAVVVLLPETATVREGAPPIQLTATATDARGNAIIGRSFTWTTSSGSIATVNSSGQVLGRNPGTVTIKATLDGKFDSTVVTVTP